MTIAGAPSARVSRASKAFGSALVLRSVDLELRPGEVHALIGQNGAGKTTLVKVLAGVIAPDGGTVEVAGHRLRPRPAHAAALGVRCIHQSRALAPNLTVADNVAVSARPGLWRRRRRDAERARRALGRIGSDLEVQRRVETLAPGEAQLVEIARALEGTATVLIMDEPTAALSKAESARLLDVVRSLRSSNMAILIVSHDLDEVVAIADRITVLRDGAVVLTAPMTGIDRGVLVNAMLGHGEDAPAASLEPRGVGPEVLALSGVGSAGLRKLDVSLRARELVGVTGILGSGIDDIAHIAAGALTPATGQLRVDGRVGRFRSPAAALAAGVAYIPGDRAREAVFPTLRALEHIEMSRLATSRQIVLHRRQERDAALRSAAQVHLAPQGLDLPVPALSGGNQQKVVVARALRTTPSVLVAHEPTSGVDVGARRAIHAELHRVRDDGGAVLLVSSDFNEVAQLSDRVLVIRRGVVVFEGRQASAGLIAELAMGERR